MTDTLLELIDRLPARGRLEGWWNAPVGSLEAHGVPSSALPVFGAWLAMRAQRPVLALVTDPEGSFQEAGAWFREDVRTVVFPAVETLPFDRLAPDEETVRRRLEAIDLERNVRVPHQEARPARSSRARLRFPRARSPRRFASRRCGARHHSLRFGICALRGEGFRRSRFRRTRAAARHSRRER